MTSVARSMKRHGLTSKPSLRLVSAVESGGQKYYAFDISDSGHRHTVSAADFWRGGGVDLYPDFRQRVIVGVEQTTDSDVTHAAPAPEPALAQQKEYACVRDLKPGDVILPMRTKRAKPREIVRVVPGRPNFAVHYVWEGEAALRTSFHVPGQKFILIKPAAQ